jgi:protein PhnA
MTIESDLLARSGSCCELCFSSEQLDIFAVADGSDSSSSSYQNADQSILICNICSDQINNPENVDLNHWRCLNDSMWSQVPAVQVMAWRMLTRLRAEGWPQELLDILYLDHETLAWAQATGEGAVADDDGVIHKDCNGAVLAAGDTVTLTKDLNVKGTSFVAKRGTAVRNISLVSNNEEHIEGRVNGTQIVILTKFAKRAN